MLRPGSVDVARFVELHPASAQLRLLKRDLARLDAVEPAVQLLPVKAPSPIDLPLAAPVEVPETPPLRPDPERSRRTVREDFTFRRLAEPDRLEERYQAELERLRRRYLEARLEIPQVETEPQITEAARRAREMDRLERRIRELDDPPARRALLSLEELRERRTLREQAQRDLEELQREEIRRLREVLTVRRRQPLAPPVIPPAELARIERERNEGKVAHELQVVREEQQALARLENESLPSPAAAEAAVHPPEPAQPPQGTRLTQPVGTSCPVPLPALQPSQAALRAEFRALNDAIYRDLTVISREAARRKGIELQPRSVGVPDRTTELLPSVRELLAAASKEPSQRTKRKRGGSER